MDSFPAQGVLIEDARPCPGCGELAEPEQDSDVLYWACLNQSCLMEFGHHRTEQQDPACQLGIPEQVRRQAGGIIPAEIASTRDRPPVFLGQIHGRPA